MNIRPGRNKDAAIFNVLYLDYGIGFGGAVISMAELVNHLPDSISTFVLSAQDKAIIVPLLKKGVHLFFPMPVNYVLRERLGWWLEEIRAPRLVRHAALKCYALIDLVMGFAYSIYIFRILKKKHIHLLHINNGPDFNGTRAAAWAKIPCITHCRGFGGPDRRILRYKHYQATVKKFIAISKAVAVSLRENCVSDDLIEVVHNPVHWEKYDSARPQRQVIRDKLGFAPDDVVVSIFGRITEWKGQLEFLQAMNLLIADCPKLRIMIVGAASDDIHGYAKTVEDFSQQSALRDRVVFTGYQQNVVDYYWSSDIVVHNSIIPEPFGRVVTEAMACGCPIVAMMEGGPVDIIQHNYDGILIPPRNQGELMQAVRRLYHSPAERMYLANNARASIRQKFSGEVIARRIVEIYEDVLRGSSGSAAS
jgi:glycosyltransferase involved in cell wall biosynthesis